MHNVKRQALKIIFTCCGVPGIISVVEKKLKRIENGGVKRGTLSLKY
jgi:hypothetical protein